MYHFSSLYFPNFVILKSFSILYHNRLLVNEFLQELAMFVYCDITIIVYVQMGKIYRKSDGRQKPDRLAHGLASALANRNLIRYDFSLSILLRNQRYPAVS